MAALQGRPGPRHERPAADDGWHASIDGRVEDPIAGIVRSTTAYNRANLQPDQGIRAATDTPHASRRLTINKIGVLLEAFGTMPRSTITAGHGTPGSSPTP